MVKAGDQRHNGLLTALEALENLPGQHPAIDGTLVLRLIDFRDAVLLRCALHHRHGVLAEQTLYFRAVKDLALPPAAVDVRVVAEEASLAVTVSCPTLVKTLCLETDPAGGHISDNYFDLLPGVPRTVRFTPSRPMHGRTLERNLWLWHMALMES
ncbi:MAG: glycoside hydrolase family 2 protein [Steroidobacteraceae bacterium]